MLPVEKILALLTEAPPGIAEMTAGLSPDQLRARPAPDGWSLNDVLAHLRSCEDVWGGCVKTIVAEDKPAFRAVNPRTWIKQTNYLDLEFRPSLRAFARQRAELLAVLEALPPEGWARSATVSVAGKPYQRTVLWYAGGLATHERSHVKQIKRMVDALRE